MGSFEEEGELPARPQARGPVRLLQVHVPTACAGRVQVGARSDPRLRHLRRVHPSPACRRLSGGRRPTRCLSAVEVHDLLSLGAQRPTSPLRVLPERQYGRACPGSGEGRPSEAFVAFCDELRLARRFLEPTDPEAKGALERLQRVSFSSRLCFYPSRREERRWPWRLTSSC